MATPKVPDAVGIGPPMPICISRPASCAWAVVVAMSAKAVASGARLGSRVTPSMITSKISIDGYHTILREREQGYDHKYTPHPWPRRASFARSDTGPGRRRARVQFHEHDERTRRGSPLGALGQARRSRGLGASCKDHWQKECARLAATIWR